MIDKLSCVKLRIAKILIRPKVNSRVQKKNYLVKFKFIIKN